MPTGKVTPKDDKN